MSSMLGNWGRGGSGGGTEDRCSCFDRSGVGWVVDVSVVSVVVVVSVVSVVFVVLEVSVMSVVEGVDGLVDECRM